MCQGAATACHGPRVTFCCVLAPQKSISPPCCIGGGAGFSATIASVVTRSPATEAAGKGRIGHEQPTSRRNAVGLAVEAFRMCQMWVAYSAMLRSLENLAEPAMFRMALRTQA